MMYEPNNLLKLDNKNVEQLLTVTCKPDGGVDGVPVVKLSEWNSKLLVYYVKLCALRRRPLVLVDINDNTLMSIEDHQNLVTLHDNAEKYLSVIAQTHITKNIDLVWEIINNHLQAIRGTKGVPILWCVLDTVFSK